jgi:hypothetical protein
VARLRIVIGNSSLAGYPQGGGHWTGYLQYLLGLDDLGHQVFWLELFRSKGDREEDERLIDRFFSRMGRYGFRDHCGLLLFDNDTDPLTLDAGQPFGVTRERIAEIAKDADLFWNIACAFKQPLLELFKRRVLIDLDPGHLQVSALTWDMGISDHEVLLTVGGKLHDRDCEVPTLGLTWHSFTPFVYLPMWKPAPDPGPQAPFTSVTHWTWDELWLGGRVLSTSKRSAYLRCLDLPHRAGRPFEIAANIHPSDDSGDRELLLSHGWNVVHPYNVAESPAAYQEYIARSRAELHCPKPIFRELRTGFFSERSVCYLASGRPVLTEDTGFAGRLPIGEGLLVFGDLDEALAGIRTIDSDYANQSLAARRLAEEYFDSRRSLEGMLAACI